MQIVPPVGDPHQLSEHTQTNWNGILGRIELQVKDVYFHDRRSGLSRCDGLKG